MQAHLWIRHHDGDEAGGKAIAVYKGLRHQRAPAPDTDCVNTSQTNKQTKKNVANKQNCKNVANQQGNKNV
eukprot:1175753-Prorocentrum_minimum.AAC.1